MDETLQKLAIRFNQSKHLHPNLRFEDIQIDLTQHLSLIEKMENTDGEPNIVLLDQQLYVIDMVKETPLTRANMCYDQEARLKRKKYPPKTSVIEEIQQYHGLKLLDEQMYQKLQIIEPLDLKTSCWLLTESKLRQKGGAIFGDRRFDRVFIYHNSADSYYSTRGYRSYFQLSK
jgi:hypothetical protein